MSRTRALYDWGGGLSNEVDVGNEYGPPVMHPQIKGTIFVR